MKDPRDVSSLDRALKHVLNVSLHETKDLLPSQALLHDIETRLLSNLPVQGYGVDNATTHILDTIVPGLNCSSLSPNYYGFVTGGSTPAARIVSILP